MFAQIETSEVAMSQHLTWGSMAESMAEYLSGGDKAVLTPDKYSAKAKAFTRLFLAVLVQGARG